MHQRQRRFDQRVRQIGEHALDLRRRQHALVDERLRRQADDVERLARVRGQLQRLDCVLDALADDVERALEADGGRNNGPRSLPSSADGAVASMNTCSNAGATAAALRPTLPRLAGTARQPSTRCPSSAAMRSISALQRQPRRLVVGEEHEPGAVGTCRRQRKGHGLTQKAVGHLDQDAGAVAGAGVGAAGAAVFEVDQQVERVADDRVRALALDVGDEADAAGVVLVSRSVQPRFGATLRRPPVLWGQSGGTGRQDPQRESPLGPLLERKSIAYKKRNVSISIMRIRDATSRARAMPSTRKTDGFRESSGPA